MPVTEKYLIVIVGPTAIGKTSLSVALAKHFSSEIISADSRQFYKEMSIGTAVPSKDELEAVPHHFIHHKSVEENYNTGDFELDAVNLLDKLFQKHQVLFMVGGSGLYIDAVVDGLDDFPKTDPNIRKELNQLFETEGIAALQQKLKQQDPEYYRIVDIHNPHRLIRALEVCLQTGKPFSSFLRKNQTMRNFKTLKIGLTAERQLIYDRINERVDIMMQNGLLREAEALFEKRHLNALQTVGYRELFSYLENQISLETAVEEIKKNTRRYAKRQMTWFRKDESIHWLPYDTEVGKVVDFILAVL